MAKKPPILVALDLETTGLHVEQDTILEIAAIKFQGETVLDTLETLVDPGRSVSYRVQRLTNITPSQLIGTPSFDSIAEKVQQFIGDLPIVGHSIPFDVGFLRRRGLVHTNPLIDTFELATVLLPSLPSYNLGQVAEALGILVAPGRHRAMVDTVLAMNVFLALHERLQTVDLSLLKDLASLDAPRTWPLLGFFRQELRRRQEQDGLEGKLIRGSLGDRFAAQLGVDPRVLSFAVARDAANVPTLASGTPIEGITGEQPVQPVLKTLEQMQSMVAVIPEQAKQQQPAQLGYQTARTAIYSVLEQKTPLLMEVTVGSNDYTPTLLPVLEWLMSSPTHEHSQAKRLVIACANRQGARQFMTETLPRLQATLKSDLPVAYLARKNGYLCLHRWFGPALRRTSGELTAEQARGLAKFGLWAQQTHTGERSELTLLPQEATAWDRISSGVERIPAADTRSGTPYERCIYRHKGYCFVARAEERVKQATIVVTTHAGMLDDLFSSHSLLSVVENRIILDADLLEEETARWSSVELDTARLNALLNTIGTVLSNGRYQGLLALAAPSLRENGPGGLSTTPTIANSELDARMRSWFQMLGQASNAVDQVFKSFSLLLEEYMQGTEGNGRDKGRNASIGRSHSGHGGHVSQGGRLIERTDQPLRLTGQIRNLSAWMNVERAWQQAAQRLQSAIDLAHEAERIILTAQRSRHRLDVGIGEEDSLASEFAALAYQLQEQKRLGQQALALNEDDNVYWLRMPPTPSPTAQQRQTVPPAVPTLSTEQYPILYSQLAQTPTFFRKMLLRPGFCTIFAGVGLSVDNNFSFCRGRFGIDTDNYSALSVVTDHHEQTLLYLPNDVPEPNMPQYQRHLDEALVQLATALEGQMVVLFTSHASLRSSYATIKPILEGRGILVLAQGIDGSPRQLWSNFSTQGRVIVLGAGSFWDSIGEIHPVPACIVITRLPMPVLNDPPVAARADHYNDLLSQLTVPVASLRVRRALNRLAWSDTQRNAVVLFDRRIISKEYGATILHTLPHCSQRQDGISHAPETILDWLTATGSWD